MLPLRTAWLVGVCLLSGGLTAVAADRPDMLIADFEGKDYGGWSVDGEAFGSGPARGTLPGQMAVSGFKGAGLVNSFYKGDATTGTLTSPAFTIDRSWINFLIGGGGYEGATCMNLVVEGKTVRTATGPNTTPGGSEQLEAASWDVTELLGKTATIVIVDRRTGGWGHINVDEIVQSDVNRATGPVRRDLVVDRRFLRLPVKQGEASRRVKVTVGGEVVREFDIKLAAADQSPDFWVTSDLEPFRGKSATVETRARAAGADLDALSLVDAPEGAADGYNEPRRPRFHFTSRRGWNNDPNGLVWHEGEYHLFYQHNPYGWDWGNMHWGHAVSPDLVHWTELSEALTPRKYGDFCFSGSAVVDEKNTSGFGTGGRPPLVLAFTSTGRGECIAYSNDRGRTWTEYDRNPVVSHRGRDPRLLWHQPTKRWIMAVYDEPEGKRQIAFHSSPDLKTWTYESRIDNFFECPDLFELPVEGEPDRRLWVLYAADGQYLLGTFDGHVFMPESTGKQRLWYGNFYAAQTFSNLPDGRRIQIGWGQGVTFSGMPFNQQMTLPVRLTLRRSNGGPRLYAEPVEEMDRLAKGRPQAVTRDTQVEEFRMRVQATVGRNGTLELMLRGIPVVYDAVKQRLTCARVEVPLEPVKGRITLELWVDRGSVEVFANGGGTAVSAAAEPIAEDHGIRLKATGETRLESAVVTPLTSAWR